jgi:hypothetical protein
MRATLAILGALAVLGFFLSFLVEASFVSRGRLMEIVRKSPEGLHQGGQGYRSVAAARLMVLDDGGAFLPGFGDQGEILVDEEYLKRHHVYPVAVKSFELMGWISRVGCGMAGIACLAGFALIPKLGKRLD